MRNRGPADRSNGRAAMRRTWSAIASPCRCGGVPVRSVRHMWDFGSAATPRIAGRPSTWTNLWRSACSCNSRRRQAASSAAGSRGPAISKPILMFRQQSPPGGRIHPGQSLLVRSQRKTFAARDQIPDESRHRWTVEIEMWREERKTIAFVQQAIPKRQATHCDLQAEVPWHAWATAGQQPCEAGRGAQKDRLVPGFPATILSQCRRPRDVLVWCEARLARGRRAAAGTSGSRARPDGGAGGAKADQSPGLGTAAALGRDGDTRGMERRYGSCRRVSKRSGGTSSHPRIDGRSHPLGRRTAEIAL